MAEKDYLGHYQFNSNERHVQYKTLCNLCTTYHLIILILDVLLILLTSPSSMYLNILIITMKVKVVERRSEIRLHLYDLKLATFEPQMDIG